jgi:pimeloyl-ACP methyl ester carboxylesterase
LNFLIAEQHTLFFMRNTFISLLLIIMVLSGCKEMASKTGQDKAGEAHAIQMNEKLFVGLGGEEQYVEISGTDDSKPVLLFIHGGPGWPQTPHLRYFNSDLARHFILVSWDQSGCGQSFIKNPSPQNLNAEQVIADAHELTTYLKKKFGKTKIYLAGFSWGSIIGLQVVNKYPEDYSAYFGISQVIDIQRSITLSRDWIKQQAILKNDTAVLRQLKLLEIKDTSYCKNDLECFLKKYELLSVYNGAVHTKSAQDEIAKAEAYYEDYKNYDWLKGFLFSAEKLGDALFATDLKQIKTLKVPAYFLVGQHDWSVPTAVTEEYFANLDAPEKELIWFGNSGHEVSSEEPDKFNRALYERIKN